jgi:hypothetical protein
VKFSVEELTTLGLTPARGATVALTAYDLTVKLDLREPADGPVAETWLVTRA